MIIFFNDVIGFLISLSNYHLFCTYLIVYNQTTKKRRVNI